jgi:TonB family protein
LAKFKYCYERQLAVQPKLQGRVALEFTIDAKGRVTAVRIRETSLNNDATEKCMERVAGRLVFPKPAGGGVVTVIYPFIFRPAAP